MILLCLMVISISIQLGFTREKWVDPHDMNVIKNSKPTFQTTENTCIQNCDCTATSINFSMSYYKRLINLILTSLKIDGINQYNGKIHMDLSAESYDFLRKFASDTNNVEDSSVLRKVDEIISKVLKKPTHEQIVEELILWTDRVYYTFYNRNTFVLLSCLFVLFISYKLLRANLTIWSVVKYLIFLGWIVDFAFTWMNLLQEAEINKMADSLMYQSIPPNCDPNKMSIWQYMIYSLGSKSECRNYHQAVLKDHFWSIAPVTVLSHQFGILVYTPSLLVGQAIGSFTSGILNTLPWGVNVILLPALLIFSAIIGCIIFSFLTRTSFAFNFFHMFQLEFGNDQRQAIGDVLTGHNVAALLNIAQRNMVEDVKQAENNTTENSNCSKTIMAKDKKLEMIKPSESSSLNSDLEKVNIQTNAGLKRTNKSVKLVKSASLELINLTNLDKSFKTVNSHDGSGDKF